MSTRTGWKKTLVPYPVLYGSLFKPRVMPSSCAAIAEAMAKLASREWVTLCPRASVVCSSVQTIIKYDEDDPLISNDVFIFALQRFLEELSSLQFISLFRFFSLFLSNAKSATKKSRSTKKRSQERNHCRRPPRLVAVASRRTSFSRLDLPALSIKKANVCRERRCTYRQCECRDSCW